MASLKIFLFLLFLNSFYHDGPTSKFLTVLRMDRVLSFFFFFKVVHVCHT